MYMATSKSDVDVLVDSGLNGLKLVDFINDIRSSLDGKDVVVIGVNYVDRESAIEKKIYNTRLRFMRNNIQ